MRGSFSSLIENNPLDSHAVINVGILVENHLQDSARRMEWLEDVGNHLQGFLRDLGWYENFWRNGQDLHLYLYASTQGAALVLSGKRLGAKHKRLRKESSWFEVQKKSALDSQK